MKKLISAGTKMRFKTLDEMRTEYGPSWRSDVQRHWLEPMDKLSGKEFTLGRDVDPTSGNRTICSTENVEGQYYISLDMAVELCTAPLTIEELFI